MIEERVAALALPWNLLPALLRRRPNKILRREKGVHSELCDGWDDKKKNNEQICSHCSGFNETEFLMSQLGFLDKLGKKLVKGGAPHQDWDEFGSVCRLHHTRLFWDVEMDDLFFKMFVLQQVLQVLSNKTKSRIRQLQTFTLLLFFQ